MPAAAVSAVGAAGSLYSGIKSSKDAKKSLAFAKKQYANNQRIGKELKERWNRLVEPTLEDLMSEAKSKDLSLSGRLAVEDLDKGLGKLRTEILNDTDAAGEGLTESRLMTLDLDRARGIADIRLDDEAAKRSNLTGLMTFAAQTPGWAQIQTGANSDMANFSTAIGVQQQGAAASAYGAAAQGLAQLGQMWGEYSYVKQNPNYVPSYVRGSGGHTVQ